MVLPAFPVESLLIAFPELLESEPSLCGASRCPKTVGYPRPPTPSEEAIFVDMTKLHCPPKRGVLVTAFASTPARGVPVITRMARSIRTNQMNDLTIHKEHVRTGRGIPSSGLFGKDLSNVLHQVEPDVSHFGSRSSRLVPPL